MKVDPEETSIRFIKNAIELALTLGDFQKELESVRDVAASLELPENMVDVAITK